MNTLLFYLPAVAIIFMAMYIGKNADIKNKEYNEVRNTASQEL